MYDVILLKSTEREPGYPKREKEKTDKRIKHTLRIKSKHKMMPFLWFYNFTSFNGRFS